ncbi:MAG: glycosyl hydrolase family 18 protein [Cyclobacteriaceae bacterium]
MCYLKKHYLPLLFAWLALAAACQQETYQATPDLYVEDTTFKVVGYLNSSNFDSIDRIELDKITYLNLAFANPDAQGELVFRRGKDLTEVVEKAHAQGVKVFLSLAGGGIREEEKTYWKTVLEPAHRAAFIEKILAYVEKHNLDGVDVDIEGNLMPTIGDSYTPFVLDLRKALHAKGKGITAALPGPWLHPGMAQEALEAYDFINIMAYDDTGPWNPDKPGPHSPYSFAERSVDFWLNEKKIPPHRLVLGMPFYGYDFDKIGAKHYRQIVMDNPADAYRDELGQLYYNGIPTIVKKTQLAIEKVNGVMFWELAQDASNELSLLRAVNQIIDAGDCEGEALTTYFADQDGDGFGDITKPLQACTLPPGYVTNQQDCNDTDAAIHPQAPEVADGLDHNCDGEVN